MIFLSSVFHSFGVMHEIGRPEFWTVGRVGSYCLQFDHVPWYICPCQSTQGLCFSCPNSTPSGFLLLWTFLFFFFIHCISLGTMFTLGIINNCFAVIYPVVYLILLRWIYIVRYTIIDNDFYSKPWESSSTSLVSLVKMFSWKIISTYYSSTRWRIPLHAQSRATVAAWHAVYIRNWCLGKVEL